jgi:integrase
VDTDKCTLHIDCGKNKKERIVPMDATLAEHCKRYIDAVHAGHEPKHLLVFSRDGKSYGVSNIEKHFRALLWEIDIPYCGKDLGPRVHDLRHTFICHRLKEWAEDGTDLMNALPILSKYVGHENISGTEWYLKLTVEAFPAITGAMNELTGYVFPQVGG